MCGIFFQSTKINYPLEANGDRLKVCFMPKEDRGIFVYQGLQKIVGLFLLLFNKAEWVQVSDQNEVPTYWLVNKASLEKWTKIQTGILSEKKGINENNINVLLSALKSYYSKQHFDQPINEPSPFQPPPETKQKNEIIPEDEVVPEDEAIPENNPNSFENKQNLLDEKLKEILSKRLTCLEDGNEYDSGVRAINENSESFYVLTSLKQEFLSTPLFINSLSNNWYSIVEGEKQLTFTLESLRQIHLRATSICTVSPSLDRKIQERLMIAAKNSSYVVGLELDKEATKSKNYPVFAIFEKEGEKELSRTLV